MTRFSLNDSRNGLKILRSCNRLDTDTKALETDSVTIAEMPPCFKGILASSLDTDHRLTLHTDISFQLYFVLVVGKMQNGPFFEDTVGGFGEPTNIKIYTGDALGRGRS